MLRCTGFNEGIGEADYLLCGVGRGQGARLHATDDATANSLRDPGLLGF